MVKHFVGKKKRPMAFWVAAAFAPAALSLTTAVQAAEWKITPSVNLTETYSDNVALVSDDQAKRSFITQVTPAIDILANGSQLKLHLNYAAQNLSYSNDPSGGGVRTNHLLNANANAELIKNLFFLDSLASISQQNQTPFGQETTDNLNLSSNRVEVRTYSISPFLRTTFDKNASGELRYSYDSVKTSNNSAADSTSDHIQATLKSGTAFKVLEWNLKDDDQKIHYNANSSNDIEFRTTTANLTYHITSLFAATGSAGYEKNTYATLTGEAPSGPSWSLGFNWTPSERTNLSASAGHRFFGNTYSLNATERTRASLWTLSYNEDITTSRSQFLIPGLVNTADYLNQLFLGTIPDPVQRQQQIANFIAANNIPATAIAQINTISNNVFLQKNLLASFAITGVRNTVLLSLFNTKRTTQSAGLDFSGSGTGNALLDDTRLTGINAMWTLKLTERTDATLTANYNRVISALTNITDNNKIYKASLGYQVQPKLRAMLELRHQGKTSTLATSEFEENAASLFLTLGF